MPLHLIKLAVGIESLDHLIQVQADRRAESGRVSHVTRMIPRRGDEILEGGSIYWVVKGTVAARNPVIALEHGTGDDGRGFCRIVMGPLFPVAGLPRRPFQGWRYLKAEDAPPDITLSGNSEPPPADMAAELRALGLL